MATILVVDDLAANREVLVSLLRACGHELIEARDGSEALSAVYAKRPDLVITDVLMPVMDGYELVRLLRLDPDTSTIPVLFYTAHYGEREARALALANGVAHILLKPVEPEEALRVVGLVLSGESQERNGPGSPALTPDFDRQHLRLLTDKLSEKEEDLRVANARLRALINVGLELASQRDSHRMLECVCSSARDLFGATYVSLGILDRSDRSLQQLHVSGLESPSWIDLGGHVSGVLDAVIAERRPARGINPDADPAKLYLPARHPLIRAYLIAPVCSPSYVYGWICLVGNEGQEFSEHDEQLVMALAGQTGRTYENGYFHSVAQSRADELMREIVDRQRAEEALRAEREALREAEERTRFVLQSADVGIWDMDYKTGRLRWSETLEAHYGLAPGSFDGSLETFTQLIHPDDREGTLQTIGNAITTGASFRVQHRALWPSGEVRWLTAAGRAVLGPGGEPIRAVGISTDVTERHSLEEQYHQAQKMEAIGRLAGGIAHDFNNLLTAILGYSEMLMADLEPTDPHREDVAEIQNAGLSAASLTRQLLAFSRKEIIEPTLLDLNHVVKSMRSMLGRIIGEDIHIVLDLDPDLRTVRADRGQLEQVVMNLVVNARDAMLGGGKLTIQTENLDLDEKFASTHVAVSPGPHVRVTVSDTGMGIAEPVRAHLFEPFFTTKKAGAGTGLGLATVHGIVTRSGGIVEVESEVGEGASFRLYFPVANDPGLPAEEPSPASRPHHATHTILLVDDSEGLRELTRRLLLRIGYTVLVAESPSDAIRVFDEHPEIDLVLSDVVMPGLSGPDMVRLLSERRPELRVVFMSGYTDDAMGQHGILGSGVAFLHKPFTSDALASKIREQLER